MKKIAKTFLIVSSLFFFLPLNAFAIGQVTEPIVIENALREQEYDQILVLFNSEKEERNFDLNAEGEIADWVKFYKYEDISNIPINSVKIPAESKIYAVARFVVPEDVSNNTYLGKINFMTVSDDVSDDEKSESEITVLQKISRKVTLTVSDKEVFKCDISITPLSIRLKENEPLKIEMTYRNQGNVVIKPQIHLKIVQNDGKTIHNAIYPYPEDKGGVKPSYPETIPIEWQTIGQEKGEYQTEIKVLLNDEIIKEDDFNFNIGVVKNNADADNPNKYPSLISRIGGGNTTVGYFLIGGFILLLSVFSFTISKRRRKKRREREKE